METAEKRRFRPSDFEIGALLGEGAYAQVFHAKLKGTGETFAIKMLDKNFILKHGKEQFVLNERKVLSMVRHPLLMKLYSTFQDSASLYFVLELAPGGELFKQVKQMEKLPLEVVKFYVAEIATAIAYLHGLGIIHRDLKPENILLSGNGHIILTDFGTAKIVSEGENAVPEAPEPGDKAQGSEEDKEEEEDDDDGWGETERKRNNSFVGTAEYVSPELLKDEKAGFAVDLWALGCIVYTLIAGTSPFRGATEYLTFQNILKRELSFPDDFPPEARDLVEQLLQLDPMQRIGHRAAGGWDELWQHPFFAGISFQDLHLQESPAFDLALQDLPSNLNDIDSDADFPSLHTASIQRNSGSLSDLPWYPL